MPFRGSFYEKFGYGFVERRAEWTMPMAVLPKGDFGDDCASTSGRFRRARPLQAAPHRAHARRHRAVAGALEAVHRRRGRRPRRRRAHAVGDGPDAVVSMATCRRTIAHDSSRPQGHAVTLSRRSALRRRRRPRASARLPRQPARPVRDVDDHAPGRPAAELAAGRDADDAPRQPQSPDRRGPAVHADAGARARPREAARGDEAAGATRCGRRCVVAIREVEGDVTKLAIEIADGRAAATPTDASADVEMPDRVWATVAFGDLPGDARGGAGPHRRDEPHAAGRPRRVRRRRAGAVLPRVFLNSPSPRSPGRGSREGRATFACERRSTRTRTLPLSPIETLSPAYRGEGVIG